MMDEHEAKRIAQARAARARRKEQLRRERIRFFALSFVCILLLAGVITAVIELPGKKIPTSDSASQSTSAGDASSTPAPDSGTAEETTPEIPVPPAQTGAIGPVLQTEWEYTVPTTTLLTLPENGRVDMAYFDDALFIGDSITQGFQVYASGIKNAKYAAYIGVGPKQLMSGTVTNINGEVVTAIDEIRAAQPKKVYLLLGTNALSNLEDEALLQYYSDFLDFLAPQLPQDTVYYLQAIPPVTKEKNDADAKYSNERIRALNEGLAKICFAHGWHFLDLYSALADGEKNLRGELMAGDGVHLNGQGYEVWKEYLVTHTAYSKTSPYIAGSPYIL